MKKPMIVGTLVSALLLTLAGLFVVAHEEVEAAGERSWPESLDAVAAAPASHEVLLENEKVRVLEVVILPGEKEPMHTHRWPSVMFVDEAARIRYYNKDDVPVYESPEDRPPVERPMPEWMKPEGPHAVENIDTRRFHAIRVELKTE